MAAVRTDTAIVGNYRQVLGAAHCADLRCTHTGYQTYFAEIDAILFDHGRPPLSSSTVRRVLSDQAIPPTLSAAEHDIERRLFRQAFRVYLDDFTSNVSSVRTLYLDDKGGTEGVRFLLEQLSRRAATPGDADSLVAISNEHPNEFAPLLYLGAVLLELGCKAQALHVYRTIPYVRPVVKSTYSGVTSTAMRLALSIDPDAWRRSPADWRSRNARSSV